MTNREVRDWYLHQTATIEDLDKRWILEGCSFEQRARRAWKIRHDARLTARSMMTDPEEVELLRKRDLLVYGNADGPTFEQLVKSQEDAGLRGDAAYLAIIRGAQTTNPEVNKNLEG
jgi:hypothetical protein